MSLFYRGKVTDDTSFKIVLKSDADDTIATKRLQWGYKLYGPDYPIIDTLPSC